MFEAEWGSFGIQICYDVEFPELSRLMADEGMNILFVPFLTDTQNAYTRVKHCAQARAIENECYVAIAGCVGNLPKVNNMDIQYAQSAVFTPSDFAFPSNGIKAEATTNTEMTLIVDVDLNGIKDVCELENIFNGTHINGKYIPSNKRIFMIDEIDTGIHYSKLKDFWYPNPG